jgi:hypothetical protein
MAWDADCGKLFLLIGEQRALPPAAAVLATGSSIKRRDRRMP